MSSSTRPELSFAELDLPSSLQETLSRVGYEKPSPIQQATIPILLQGRDVVGMAQTGTGKTAAFALPILAGIDLSQKHVQALVLCPTRELAIQVAEAFQTYAAGMRGFQVLPIYGGQEMGRQLSGLRRGAQVVVGTPGRLLDHLNRRTVDLTQLKTLVLDEADEMLRMGFIDDVETILATTPKGRQVALFSATMPPQIRAVAQKYLDNPEEIRIQTAITTNENIEQFYWLVQGTNKLDALTRILEVEEFDGMIIFVRTKTSTVDLADKLSARGFAASPLNGDMNQAIRTRTIEQLKSGHIDILVATDVAARGLDVERLSHVMNYDIPYDDEAYVHRIGRTGRAGRSGKAILFVAPRERRLLQSIEKTTRKKITQMELPTRGELIEKRSAAFKEGISETIRSGNLDFFRTLVTELCEEHSCDAAQVGAAMAFLLQKDRPLEPAIAEAESRRPRSAPTGRDEWKEAPSRQPSAGRARTTRASSETQFEQMLNEDGRSEHRPRHEHSSEEDGRAKPLRDFPDVRMERFRIHVGHADGVTPREVVGAIANEAQIEGRYIGHIRIYDDYCTVDLPAGMPRETMHILAKTRVRNKPLKIEQVAASGGKPAFSKPESSKPESSKPEFSKPESSKRESSKPEFSKAEFKKSEFKKPEFKKPEFKKSEFKKPEAARPESKPEFKKAEFKKPEPKPEFKKSEFKKPDFKNSEFKKTDEKKFDAKKAGFKKTAATPERKADASSRGGEGRPVVESKDITREVLERFPSLGASPRAATPAAGGEVTARVRTKPKSKRVDKDKGKRRKPSDKAS